MSSQVEQIKERLGIVDVVSQYIKLEKAGSNFRARCPFHNEKTPSFFVSPTRNSYYCFGCNAKGDIFSFVEQFEGLDFVGALKVLGEKAGVQIVFEKVGERDEKERLYNAMESATVFFEDNLKQKSEIHEYLKKRGLTDTTIKDWRIGYAPDSWSGLYDHLKNTYSIQELERVGLIKKKENGSDYYDRFRGRIMFPIFDNSGRVVAFSGRIVKDDGKNAKYLNSPETQLFSKSKILYGYDRAKFSIRKLDFSIVVEGQMDLLASHQAGFTNTVALSGTALTAEHINLLKRMSNNVVLAFDSDNAGIASSGKSAKEALAKGMDVKVTHLKEGSDPADVLQKDLPTGKTGKEEWRKAIRNSKHIVDFSLDILFETISDKRKLRLKASQNVLPYIKRIQNKIDQAHFISVVGHRLGVSEDVIREELNKVSIEDDTAIDSKNDIVINQQPKELNKKNSIENRIVGIVLWQKSLEKPIINIKSIIIELERILGKEKALHIIEKNDNMEELLYEIERLYSGDEKLEAEVYELLQNLEREFIKDNLDKVLDELKYAEVENDTDKLAEILKKHKELSNKLANINTLK